MASLPTLSGQEVVAVFETLGWKVNRQRGSHIILEPAVGARKSCASYSCA